MSSKSINNVGGCYLLCNVAAESLRIAIVVAQWNGDITAPLCDGAVTSLIDSSIPKENISVFHVPGAFELTYAAARLNSTKNYDAVIVLGCVIRGDTSHYDHICDGVAQGITHLNAQGECPVIFGLITTENKQQAIDRSGGILGNKGSEAAVTALQMIDFTHSKL